MRVIINGIVSMTESRGRLVLRDSDKQEVAEVSWDAEFEIEQETEDDDA